MNSGRVYSWISDSSLPKGGRVIRDIVQLGRLESREDGEAHLSGRFVRVHNAGAIYEPNPTSGVPVEVPLGDARPDGEGNFLFEPGRGGGRIDKVALAEPDFRWRYVQASHFGEVNSYYHVDRIAAYIGSLLSELGATALPPVTVIVNAHHAATERDGIRDGFRGTQKWWPFQGGHYRLPRSRRKSKLLHSASRGDDGLPRSENSSHPHGIVEHNPIHPDGEIHLGTGRRLVRYGALVESAGGSYRANASHNAGIIYHEYGHHLTRHTADFCGNDLRRPEDQINTKTALDEGTCDYLAATMMQTPHIWAFHQRHDAEHAHRRSLSSSMTMSDFDAGRKADAHTNGTIWAAGLWDLRIQMAGSDQDAARDLDRLVLLGLILLGRLQGDAQPASPVSLRRARRDFGTGLRCLLESDGILYAGRHQDVAARVFSRRGILARARVKTGT